MQAEGLRTACVAQTPLVATLVVPTMPRIALAT